MNNAASPLSSQAIQHEHEFEAEHGLPEPLPPGEHILWQGAPDWRELARRGFHVNQLVWYFAVILLWRAGTVLSQGGSAVDTLIAVLWLAPLAVLAIAVLCALAWLSAHTTAYTITDRRVVMRVGIVLSLTFNLPFRSIDAAGLQQHQCGSGDIPLALGGPDRIAYLHLWPHVRPWRVKRPEPMLRCIPQSAEVAQLLGRAWAASRGVSLLSAVAPVASPASVAPLSPQPAMRDKSPQGLMPVA